MIYIFWRLCIIKIKWCWNAYGTGYVPLPAKRRENVTGNIIIKPSVRQRFDSFMERGRVLFFSAPCGFGKSTLSDALLSGRDVLRLNAGAADFALPALSDGWDILLIDDFQMIPAEDGGQALCELIRSDPGKRFLLLSRGAPPGYLTAFQYSGLMTTLEADDLLFDREDICKYFSGCGVAVTDSEVGGILRESIGYPLGVAVTARCMSGGRPFGPEIVARAYKSEAQLLYFSKGVALAKEIGNEELVYSAYQKNIMLASTNGMYEISILYSVRTFESMKNKHSLKAGRIYSGLGYNLGALGKTKEAVRYFKKAVQIFYDLNRPEDIAEVFYNMSLNCIQMRDYRQAIEYLTLCMKTIEKLQLNSLRVCNISKLYGILALCSVLTGNRFNCERYLLSCKQFLNYVLEKEDTDEIGSIHDYAKCDDDMFLYYFAQALLDVMEEKETEAAKDYEIAERHLRQAEGNQFFCYRLFRESRIQFYQSVGRLELRDNERELLKQYEETEKRLDLEESLKVLEHVGLGQDEGTEISMHKINDLISQEGIYRAYQQKKRQMDFISVWQKLIDVTDVSAKTMMETVMKTFLYHFSVDKALYIRYQEGKGQILFNNTEVKITAECQRFLADCFEEDPRGFAVSKISSNYSAHLNIISLFGEDKVCSMVAVPFMNNGKPESILIAYVLMKDNWHSSVNRYMLDEDDLRVYELLFREVQYSLNRLDAYEKVYEMNTKLYQSAITDQLTGIYNRKGFYMRIEEIMKEIAQKGQKKSFALMFIDLDNFKGYNDTFGHDVGDLILKEMAGIFREVCGREGFVSRYGGDEFIVFIKNNRKQTLEKKAKQIYERIAERDGFKKEIERDLGRTITLPPDKKISCSIGIAGSDEVRNEEDINRLIKQADDLLYQIKTTSKGRYIFM